MLQVESGSLPKQHEKQTAKTAWLLKQTSLSLRSKILEQECYQSRLKYESIGNLTKRSKKKLNTDIHNYQNELHSDLLLLQKYCSFALDALSLIDKGNQLEDNNEDIKIKHSTKALEQKRCQKFTKMYERNFNSLSSRLSKESIDLEHHYSLLENTLQNAYTKLTSWEMSTLKQHQQEQQQQQQQQHEKQQQTKNDSHFNEATGSTTNNTKNFSNIMSKIDAEIQKDGGNTGKFLPDEHTVFLKVWKKGNENQQNIVQIARKYAPIELKLRTDDEIMEHASWYLRYMEKIEKRKECLKDWRANHEKLSTSNILKSNLKADQNGSPRLHLKINEVNIKKKKLVETWKEENSKKKRQRQDEEERVQKEKIKQDKIAQEVKCKKLHEKVSNYRKKKQEDLNKKNVPIIEKVEALQQRLKYDKITIEKRSAQGIEDARKKRICTFEKQIEVVKRDVRIRVLSESVQLGKGVIRDSQRLKQHTKTSSNMKYSACELEEKGKRNDPKVSAHNRSVAMHGRDLMSQGVRRATPSWRHGL